VALRRDGQTVWQFNFGTNATKPYFHPVALPGGPVLTWDRPEDHPWHRALWFSWKFLNGVNYWEEDPKTGRAAGRTEWSEPRIDTRPDFTARLALDLTYRPGDAPAVLTERREIIVSAPDANGMYALDWDMTFTAGGAPVLLDRTPLPDEPEGKPYGGYAGLSVRLIGELQDVRARTTVEPVVFTGHRYRGKAAALEYSGVIAGREAGMAILDHPGNLNAPTPWYAINEPVMHYFSPAVICYGPHTLPAGASLRLRYRVLVHPGRWEAERLGAEMKRFEGAR
jgi:hypothetical protein